MKRLLKALEDAGRDSSLGLMASMADEHRQTLRRIIGLLKADPSLSDFITSYAENLAEGVEELVAAGDCADEAEMSAAEALGELLMQMEAVTSLEIRHHRPVVSREEMSKMECPWEPWADD